MLRQGPHTPVPVPGLHRLMLSKEEGAGPGAGAGRLTRSPGLSGTSPALPSAACGAGSLPLPPVSGGRPSCQGQGTRPGGP